jgi:hypothetical protein
VQEAVVAFARKDDPALDTSVEVHARVRELLRSVPEASERRRAGQLVADWMLYRYDSLAARGLADRGLSDRERAYYTELLLDGASPHNLHTVLMHLDRIGDPALRAALAERVLLHLEVLERLAQRDVERHLEEARAYVAANEIDIGDAEVEAAVRRAGLSYWIPKSRDDLAPLDVEAVQARLRAYIE